MLTFPNISNFHGGTRMSSTDCVFSLQLLMARDIEKTISVSQRYANCGCDGVANLGALPNADKSPWLRLPT